MISVRGPLLWALIAFMFGCAVAAYKGIHLAGVQHTEKTERFTNLAERVVSQLKMRMQTYEYGLRGARGAVITAGVDGITREKFIAYSQSRDLDREFPGSRGYGFIRKVRPDEEASFLQAARRDGKPDFQIRQLTPHDGERLVIQYIEPEANNREAVGLDIASETNRRQAALVAMRDSTPILTRPITLVQASGKVKRGFLFLIPLYRSGASLASPESREQAAFGLAYTPLIIDEVLADFDFHDGEFSLALYDSDVEKPDRFYTSIKADAPVVDGLLKLIPVTLYGRHWQVEIKALPYFINALNLTDPREVAGQTAAISVLVAILIYLLSRERQRRSLLAQARLAAIVESANDAIIGTTLEGIITSWNRAAEQIFGYPAEEAIGQALSCLVVPSALQSEEAEILARIERGESVSHFTTVWRRRDGSDIDVSVTISPIRAADGRMMGVAKTVRDVTEQKRSEARFRLAVEAAPTAMLMMDQAQTITLANRKAEELFGYTGEELVGMALENLIPARLRQAHVGGHVCNFLAASSARTVDPGHNLCGLRKDGSEVPVEVGLNPVETPEGNLVLASVADLSQRRQLEQQLQAALERMKLAVDAAGIGIWIWRLADNHLIWDDRMLELYGAPKALRNDFSYDFWRAHVHPDDVGYVEEKLRQHITGTGIYDPIFRAIRDDGQIRWIQAAAIVERSQDGQIAQVVGINRDITEEKEAEARILELNTNLERRVEERTAELVTINRELEAFSYSVSHDLRAPLRSVDGFSNILLKSYADQLDDAGRDYLQRMRAAAQRMGLLIDDLLALSRITRTELAPEDLDLSALVEEVITQLREADPERQVEIRIQPEIRAWGDTRLVRIALDNLLGNAWKFTSKKAEACIEFGQEEHESRRAFFVRDNGAGFDMAYAQKLFGAFQRLHQVKEFPGTGIGLATVQRVVRKHGGEVWATGKVGHGAVFHFTLNR
ncbi:MAG: PAS domain S-box protein [Gammaproteobacteria bacterium]|nr:PAS domain S-box protein [Gammaproteobacteria bacterium]MCP5196050.1 PAS domain S-box protein [Gammaproteobacteria bacterium]